MKRWPIAMTVGSCLSLMSLILPGATQRSLASSFLQVQYQAMREAYCAQNWTGVVQTIDTILANPNHLDEATRRDLQASRKLFQQHAQNNSRFAQMPDCTNASTPATWQLQPRSTPNQPGYRDQGPRGVTVRSTGPVQIRRVSPTRPRRGRVRVIQVR